MLIISALDNFLIFWWI